MMEEILELEYVRNWNHTYMVYHGQIREENYEVQMLLNNHIPGLLPCHLEKRDGKASLYYEITSKQPLNLIYEKRKINYESMKALFQEMKTVFGRMDEFLLSPDLLRIDAAMIYMEPEERQFYFCFIPSEKPIKSGFHLLMEFFLERIDYADEKAVAAAYSCYKKSGEENYSFDKLFMEVFQDIPMDNKRVELRKDSDRPLSEWEETELEEDREDTAARERKGKSIIPWGLLCKVAVPIGAFLIFTVACIVFDFYRGIMEKMLMGMVILVGLLGYLIYRKKDREEAADFLLEEEFQEEWIEEVANNIQQTSSQKEIEKIENNKYGETVFFQNEQLRVNRRLEPKRKNFPEFSIDVFPFVLGKLQGAVDGVIEEDTVSRIHCKLEYEDGEYYITDLNSTNGTVVNEAILDTNRRNKLSIGDEIKLGQVVYIFA